MPYPLLLVDIESDKNDLQQALVAYCEAFCISLRNNWKSLQVYSLFIFSLLSFFLWNRGVLWNFWKVYLKSSSLVKLIRCEPIVQSGRNIMFAAIFLGPVTSFTCLFYLFFFFVNLCNSSKVISRIVDFGRKFVVNWIYVCLVFICYSEVFDC